MKNRKRFQAWWVPRHGRFGCKIMTGEFKQYITELVRYCRDNTFHGEYQYQMTFSETPAPGDTPSSCTKMEVKSDSVYLWFRITVFPEIYECYKAEDYKEIGRCVLHELCHLYLEPLTKLFLWDVNHSHRPYVDDTIERQTQRIANSLYMLLPQGWYKPDYLRARKSHDHGAKPAGIVPNDASTYSEFSFI